MKTNSKKDNSYTLSITTPSLDNILKKCPNPFITINLTKKRCGQLNLKEESEKTGTYITSAKLITRVFQEIVDGSVKYEKAV